MTLTPTPVLEKSRDAGPRHDVPPAFREKVLAWAARHNGKLYAPISHPQLSDIPSTWPPKRFEPIRRAVPADARTALDIGAHWGFFSIELAKMGLAVTAVERNPKNAVFLREIAALSSVPLTIEERSIFDLDQPDFDVVLALNIFHHFIRDEATYRKFMAFLSRLRCRTLLYQGHGNDEKWMAESFVRIPAEEMCDIICRKTNLGNWELIDTFRKRKIFRLY